MANPLPATKTQTEHETDPKRENRCEKEKGRPEQLAIELAREWNSPGDWFHQHLYVE